jgi:hypothetical protein
LSRSSGRRGTAGRSLPIKLADKLEALQLLGKHLGLFDEEPMALAERVFAMASPARRARGGGHYRGTLTLRRRGSGGAITYSLEAVVGQLKNVFGQNSDSPLDHFET